MTKTQHLIAILIAVMFAPAAMSQNAKYSADDEAIFKKYIDHITPHQSESFTCIMEKTAVFFLGTPYVANTLDVQETETLIINLRELDCVTFLENVIALSKTVRSGNLSFSRFQDELRSIRYRGGNISGYDSRLHYTSDWIYDNEQRGAMTNISRKLGGTVETKQINFMSNHRQAYNQLKTDDDMLRRISNMEDSINARGGFYYIPKNAIADRAASIPHVSAIAFTTSINGLDTTHTAFVWQEDGRTTFIHASTRAMKVVIDEKTLDEYCQGQKSCTGIIVVSIL